MTARGAKLAQRLSTIHSRRPDAIRREVVEAFRDFVTCEAGVYFTCVQADDGQINFTSPVADTDDPGLQDVFDEYLEAPALETPWLSGRLDPAVVNNFIRVRDHYRERELLRYEMQTRVTRPAQISDHMRAVLYDGTYFLGWVGVLRRGSDCFSARDEQVLQSAIGEVKSIIATAESLEEDIVGDGVYAVFTPEGELEHASKTFARWSTLEKIAYLGGRIRDVDAGRGRGGTEIRAGVEIRVVRLDSNHSVRYLVTAARPDWIRLRPESWLTDRQQEIVEYAVTGATGREIADVLDISPHTVKTHLKNIYARLGIGSRTELAAMFSHMVDD